MRRALPILLLLAACSTTPSEPNQEVSRAGLVVLTQQTSPYLGSSLTYLEPPFEDALRTTPKPTGSENLVGIGTSGESYTLLGEGQKNEDNYDHTLYRRSIGEENLTVESNITLPFGARGFAVGHDAIAFTSGIGDEVVLYERRTMSFISSLQLPFDSKAITFTGNELVIVSEDGLSKVSEPWLASNVSTLVTFAESSQNMVQDVRALTLHQDVAYLIDGNTAAPQLLAVSLDPTSETFGIVERLAAYVDMQNPRGIAVEVNKKHTSE